MTRWLPRIRPSMPLAAAVLLTACAGCSAEHDAMAARRARVAAMDVAQKRQLLGSQQRFAGLNAGEQVRLRQLHSDLERDPQGAILEQVLIDQYRWLEAVPNRKAQFLALSEDKRISELKRRHNDRAPAAIAGAQLSAEDRKIVLDWLAERIEQNKQVLLSVLPESWRNRFSTVSEQGQQRTLIWLAARQVRSGGPRSPLSVEHLRDLADRLSPSAREQFEAQQSPSEKGRLLRAWIVSAAGDNTKPKGRGRGLQPVIPPEELEDFYRDKAKLTPAERAEIDESATRLARQTRLAQRYLNYYGLAPRNSGARRGRGPGAGGSGPFPAMRGSQSERSFKPYDRRMDRERLGHGPPNDGPPEHRAPDREPPPKR